jgi:uncharacterized protein (TIGR02596 family)
MKQKAHSPVRAFSLVELLVVIAVIAIVAGFAVPAVTTMIRGSQLTQGSQMVVDQIALARQTALSRNRSIEVRFYKFADPETPGESGKKPEDGFFRAIQTFEILENGAALPLAPIQRLPTNLVINEAGLSTIMKERTVQIPSPSDPDIPGMPGGNDPKSHYVYVALRFLPDGSTDLPPSGTSTSDSWYITLLNYRFAKAVRFDEENKEVDNYFTLQIDPVTGSTRSSAASTVRTKSRRRSLRFRLRRNTGQG